MTRIFKLDKTHAQVVSKGTMFKVLKHLDAPGRVRTPVLLMDRDRIREKASLIGSGIKRSRVFYALKANPDPGVLGLVKSLGLGFEIASEGELRLLRKLGVEAGRIITSNPVKSPDFIRAAAKYGVGLFAFDSIDEVLKLSRLAPGAGVYVRLAVPNEGSEWPLGRKFGVEPDPALELLIEAAARGLEPVGITFHVGSQCLDMHSWDTALHKARALWEMAAGEGIGLRLINIGGGYPVSYTKGVVAIEAIERNIDRIISENFPPETEVLLEPGRAVVGDAGVMVSSVVGKALRGRERWVQLDVGVFNGLMESLGGIKYSYVSEHSGTRARRRLAYTVAGPSCDSMDVMSTEVMLYEPEVGGLVLVLSAGAYSTAYASEFNGFPAPGTMLV